MSNNPHPCRATLRTDALAESLLERQADATCAFREALTAFGALFGKLDFPLGSPVRGYDLDDVAGALADWAVKQDTPALIAGAYSKAGDELADAAGREYGRRERDVDLVWEVA